MSSGILYAFRRPVGRRTEKAAFEAVKRGDKKTYADLRADMRVISGDEGMLDKQASLRSFDSESLSDYSLSDVKGAFISAQTVLLTYKLHLQTSLAGKPHEGNFLVNSA